VSKVKVSSAMLVRAAILPEDMIRQLVRQGQLSPGVLEIYGSDPVPKDEAGKERWLKQFGESLDDQEMEVIKETVLDDPGRPVEVAVYNTMEEALAGEGSERVALVDQFGRLCFDLSDGRVEEGQKLEFLGVQPRELYDVMEVEPLYDGDEEKFLVVKTEKWEGHGR
jgi:hypothetical protein